MGDVRVGACLRPPDLELGRGPKFLFRNSRKSPNHKSSFIWQTSSSMTSAERERQQDANNAVGF